MPAHACDLRTGEHVRCTLHRGRHCGRGTSRSGRSGERAARMDREWFGWTRGLSEVEFCREVAEDLDVLAHGDARIGSPVGGRVEALAAEEVVLDELHIRVEAQRLVVDVAAFGVWADQETGDP